MNIKKFNKYIKENKSEGVKLFYSSRLKKLFQSLENEISKNLLKLEGTEQPVSYIDLQDINFFNCLPSNRVNRIEGITEKDLENPSDDSLVWGSKFRQPIKIGAFVSIVLPQYRGTKELENFVHSVKAKIDENNYEIRIVKGEEIRKWYLVSCYYNPHPGHEELPGEGVMDIRTPLMKSCLKQPEKQSFFDIYCENPEQVGMVIMLNENKKLVARAIVWFDCFVVDKPESPSKGVLMDRIYYTNESDVNILINYTKEQGWWYKPSQQKEIFAFVKDGEVCNKPITTKLKHHGVFDKYPYMDTMCFYTPDTGRLSSSRGKPAMNPKTGEIMERFQLHSAKGGAKRLSRER